MSTAALARAAQLRGRLMWRLALGIVVGAGAVLAAAGLLATSGYLISRAAEQPPILTLTVVIVGVRFFGISRAALRYAERLVMHGVALRASSRLRVAVFDGVARSDANRGTRPADGDLLARLVDDTDRLQDVIVRIVGPPLIALATIVTASGVAFVISPAAGALLALTLTASTITAFVMGRLGNLRAGRREAPERAELTARFTDVLAGAPELAVYGGGADRAAMVADADRRLLSAARRGVWTSGLVSGWSAGVGGIATVAVTVVAGGAVASGRLEPAVLAALVLLALGAFEVVGPLGGAGERLGPARGAADRLTPWLRVATGPGSSSGAIVPDGSSIQIRGLTVRHSEGGPPAVDGVSLTVPQGGRVAVVGPSGAGKTTLARALVRLAPVECGDIRLGGVEAGLLSDEALRDAVRLVPQDAYLFATSVADNVRLARPDADDADVREALERAGALEWALGLPDGIETEVGEDGALLSGGQRQRVVLARAVLGTARVLIVDEPTVHLDHDDGVDFVRTLPEVVPADTGLLLISHRLRGLEGFDEIVVLDAGRVIERGGHDALIRAGGWYAQAWAAQALEVPVGG